MNIKIKIANNKQIIEKCWNKHDAKGQGPDLQFSRKFPSSTNEVNFRSTDQNVKKTKSMVKSEKF